MSECILARDLPPRVQEAINKMPFYIDAPDLLDLCFPIEWWIADIEKEGLMTQEIRIELMAFMLSGSNEEV